MFGPFDRPSKLEPNPYRAFVIGPDDFAVAVHFVAADYDEMVLEKAMQSRSALCIELWCGSRKVGDVPGIT
jgi:hypothetical protein